MKGSVAEYCKILLKQKKRKNITAKEKWIDDAERETYATKIYNILTIYGPQTPTEVMKKFKSRPHRKAKDKLVVRQEIRKMTKEGIIRRIRHGVYAI
tara:strand:+ start:1091 stop:1381 length:291 start_codon:yes stop_codon:yes gene_type:complete